MDADYASEELLLLLRPTPPLTTFSRDIALRTASLHAYAYAYAYAFLHATHSKAFGKL